MSYGISEPFLQKIVPILFLTQFPKAFELLKLMSLEEIRYSLYMMNRKSKTLWGFAVSENLGLPIFRIGMKSIPYTFFPDTRAGIREDAPRLFSCQTKKGRNVPEFICGYLRKIILPDTFTKNTVLFPRRNFLPAL